MQVQIILLAKHFARRPDKDQGFCNQAIQRGHVAGEHRDAQCFFELPYFSVHAGSKVVGRLLRQ
ncbi:hypothetical protein STIN111742_01770 [Stenotrophomonas indicatrix]|nr:hypothetical protein [Stenotrophomonas indicatrix]